MILAHPHLDTVFELSSDWVSTLVVEEPVFYRRLLSDLYGQMQGDEGDLILSENHALLPISRWVELVDNGIRLDLNRRPLLGRISAALEQTAVSEDFFVRTSELLGQIEAYLDDLAFELPGDIVCEKCSVQSLVKSMGIRLRDDHDDPLERLLDFMELVAAFEGEKLFVLVGLRSLFADHHLEQFFKTAQSHRHRIFLLDSVSRKILSMERRVTIDNDLCEF